MKTHLTLYVGKNSFRTAWGLIGCIHGMYCKNFEHYYYGIKGVLGLSYTREWGGYLNK